MWRPSFREVLALVCGGRVWVEYGPREHWLFAHVVDRRGRAVW
jgi:hypothetical protein